MNRPLVAFLALVLAAPATADELPAQVFASVPEDAIQDVLFFGETRPTVIRLRIQIEDRGFRVAFADFVDRLFRYLDGDADGTLSLAEAQRGSWSQMLRSPFGGQPGLEQRVFSRLGTLTIDNGPKDGEVSRDELGRYLHESLAFAEFGIQAGAPPDNRTQAVFGLLDRDGDGRLSPEELAASDELLRRLDRDNDERIDPDELRQDLPDSNSRQFFGQPPPTSSTAETSPVVALTERSRSAVMRRLLSQYDRGSGPEGAGKDRRLDAAELAFPPDSIRRFDADGDGALDSLELEGYLADAPPFVELIVTLGSRIAGRSRFSIEPRPAEGMAVWTSGNGAVVADVGDAHLELKAGDVAQNFGNFFEQQFNAADADKNGYLEMREANQNGFVNQFFAAADRDGDGKLFKKELDGYVERQADAQQCRAMLTVTDRGRAFFEILDTDRDGKLGIRELREARRRVVETIRGAERGVALEAVPRRFELGIGRGPTPLREGFRFEPYDSTPRAVPERSKGAPAWFRHMDRNGDGDVSPREFLGPRDEFRRLDADGDGLIDPKEAQP
jgi:Ca2+-binding EF-hand superfamily protein